MEFAFATTQPWFPHTQISNPCYTAQRISWGKNCFKKQLFIYSHVSTNLCVGFMFRLTSCPSIFHFFREACELDWRVHSKASCACFGKDQKDWQALCKTPAGSRHWQEQGGFFSISFILVWEAPWDANVDESGFSLSACREYRQLSCKSTSPFPSFDVLSIVESGCIWNTSGKYRKIKLPNRARTNPLWLTQWAKKPWISFRFTRWLRVSILWPRNFIWPWPLPIWRLIIPPRCSRRTYLVSFIIVATQDSHGGMGKYEQVKDCFSGTDYFCQFWVSFILDLDWNCLAFYIALLSNQTTITYLIWIFVTICLKDSNHLLDNGPQTASEHWFTINSGDDAPWCTNINLLKSVNCKDWKRIALHAPVFIQCSEVR